MDIADLARVLGAHNIDASSLELVLTREDERIYQLTVPAQEAVERWHTLREVVAETRHWPVFGWGRRWLDVPGYRARLERGSTASILAEGEHVDLAAWQQEQVDEYLEAVKEDAAFYEEEEAGDFFKDVEGEWPEDVGPSTGFSIPRNAATRDAEPRLEIALVPTAAGWQIPAYLRFNAGFAAPAVHTAMVRHWMNIYGAEIIGVLPDLIEMYVRIPPTTRDAALALAKEQFIYCQDVVIQGTQTIQNLAAGLLNGTAWYFWWD